MIVVVSLQKMYYSLEFASLDETIIFFLGSSRVSNVLPEVETFGNIPPPPPATNKSFI